jgi:hypothetical protein
MKAHYTALALPTLLVACATGAPAPLALPVQIGSEPRGEWGERLLVEANAIPGAWIQRDTDGGAPKPERDEARGFGARMGIGNRTQSVGVMAQVYGGDDGFDAVVFGFDSDVRGRLDRDWPRWLFVRAGASLGGGLYEAGGGTSDTQLMAQLRIGPEFQLTDRLALQASFGGIVFGHPGETEAYGTFVTIGGAVTF